MAGPFYVDLASPGAWNGRDGTNSASPWLGISGLQKALDTVVAGEICYIKGTGDLSKFFTVTYDASSGTTLTDGEEVTWDAGEGAWDDGSDKGIVRVAVSTAGGSGTVEIELTVGTMPSDNDVIVGTASTQTITRAATANAAKAVDVDTNSGTNAGGFIKFIGTNSSWTKDGTRAVIDANSADTHIFNMPAQDLIWFENIEVQESGGSTKHGFYSWYSGNNAQNSVFVNCCAHNCSGNGFSIALSQLCIGCVSYSNTGTGFNSGGSNTRWLFCTSRQNGTNGFNCVSYGQTTIGCISHDNTGNDFGTDCNSHLFFNCVADGSDGSGFSLGAATNLYATAIIGCRITNHNQAGTDAGIDANSELAIIGWNYFEDNGDDPADDIINDSIAQLITVDANGKPGFGTTDSNEYTGDDTNDGYVADPAGADGAEDFSTGYTSAVDPTLRRKAIVLPWS